MKLRFTIVLLLLSSCLLSCNSEPSVTASPTAPSSQDTPISTTYPSAPVTIPITTQAPITEPLPKTSEELGGKPMLGPPSYIMIAGELRENRVIAVKAGDSIELTVRVGYAFNYQGRPLVESVEPSDSLEIHLLFDGDDAGNLTPGNVVVVDDFWSNEIYAFSILTLPDNTYDQLTDITFEIDTSALTAETGKITFEYPVKYTGDDILYQIEYAKETIWYKQQNGEIRFYSDSMWMNEDSAQ